MHNTKLSGPIPNLGPVNTPVAADSCGNFIEHLLSLMSWPAGCIRTQTSLEICTIFLFSEDLHSSVCVISFKEGWKLVETLWWHSIQPAAMVLIPESIANPHFLDCNAKRSPIPVGFHITARSKSRKSQGRSEIDLFLS